MRSTSRGAGCGGDLLAVMASSGSEALRRMIAGLRREGINGTLVPLYRSVPPADESPIDDHPKTDERQPMNALISQAPRTQMRSFHLDALRDRVFPLFTARGEREWAPGWDPVMLSGAEERGSAFQTRNHSGQATTWILTDCRPSERRVSYPRLAHGPPTPLLTLLCNRSTHGSP